MAYDSLACSLVTDNSVDRAGPFSGRPKKAFDGAMYFARDLGLLLVFDGLTRSWYRADGRTLYVASQKYLSDRFTGPALASAYTVNSGTDTDPADSPAIDTDDADGGILGNTGDAGVNVAGDGSAITGPLDWEMEEAASNSATVFVAEFMIEDITTVEFFLGLSDALASTLEMPFHFTDGTTIGSVADNACGFLFDTGADTDTIRLVGTAGTTDATAVDSGEAPTAATYHTYVMVVTPTGEATYFFDGTHIGTVEDAIAVGTNACPIIVVNSTTTTARYWRARRFACHQDW